MDFIQFWQVPVNLKSCTSSHPTTHSLGYTRETSSGRISPRKVHSIASAQHERIRPGIGVRVKDTEEQQEEAKKKQGWKFVGSKRKKSGTSYCFSKLGTALPSNIFHRHRHFLWKSLFSVRVVKVCWNEWKVCQCSCTTRVGKARKKFSLLACQSKGSCSLLKVKSR